MQYRPDIDGLRAVAILCVLLFHCDFEWFSGGYIGVDVFFVISGFLITALIKSDLDAGRFSFKTFYVRRIRRLLPALVATTIVTLILSAVILAPQHLADAGRSAAFSVLSLSNFYFAREASYFDASSNLKPFLHAWSLSLEEQYYYCWPAALFLLYRLGRERALFILIGVGTVAGLAISQYWLTVNPKHAYFLLPFRAFQFLLGAGLVWLMSSRIDSRRLSNLVFCAGLALVAGPATTYTEHTSFPGLNALVPSVGAALLIFAGPSSGIAWLVANRFMIWLGRISYSTYLTHWPIVVFWKYLSADPLSLTEKVLILGLSIGSGQLLYMLVEQRYRLTGPTPRLQSSGAVLRLSLVAVITVTVGFAISRADGLPQRLQFVPKTAQYSHESEFQFLRDYHDGSLTLGDRKQGRVLIIGDSMMQNYIPAILQIPGIRQARVDVVTRGGCVFASGALLMNYGSIDTECRMLRDSVYASTTQYDLVIWSQNWLGYADTLTWEEVNGRPRHAFTGGTSFVGWRDGIARTLEVLLTRSTAVIIIGPQVSAGNVSPLLSRTGPVTSIASISRELPQMTDASPTTRGALSESLRKLVSDYSEVIFIDPYDLVCGSGTCSFSDGEFSYYFDANHHTAAAEAFLREGLSRLIACRLPPPLAGACSRPVLPQVTRQGNEKKKEVQLVTPANAGSS